MYQQFLGSINARNKNLAYFYHHNCLSTKRFVRRMLHHPVTGFNYFIHPVMFYTTSTKFRQDVKDFLFKNFSKESKKPADIEMQKNEKRAHIPDNQRAAMKNNHT